MPQTPLTIGLTYDLRDDYLKMGYSMEETAEFDSPETIAAIDGALQALGHRTDRIGHVKALATRLVRGDRWDLVFNIAEGLHGIGREAQVPALLDAYDIPYTFSDTLVLALALHKGLTKHIIRDLGIPTPDFAVVANEAEVSAVSLPYPLFCKPVAEGTGKGVSSKSRVENVNELLTVCRHLLATFKQPVLVETYLPGREFTVGILGTDAGAWAPGVMEVIFTDKAEKHAYTMDNKEQWKGRIDYQLVGDELAEHARDVALAAWRGLGCRDGGRIDVRVDALGTPSFIEVNPLAGLRPKYSDLPILCELAGMPYEEMMGHIIASARTRIKTAPDATKTQVAAKAAVAKAGR